MPAWLAQAGCFAGARWPALELRCAFIGFRKADSTGACDPGGGDGNCIFPALAVRPSVPRYQVAGACTDVQLASQGLQSAQLIGRLGVDPDLGILVLAQLDHGDSS